jgi:hypothetical protein
MISTIKRCGGILALVALSICASSTALAGPIDEAKARAHLDAIAAGDIDGLMRDYADDAYLDWIGGPLDGRYRGKAEIRNMWVKFIAANAGKPRPAEFSKLTAYSNPRGTSVEAKGSYGGAVPVKALHLLTYRDGELNTEIWQIAPAVQIEK